MPKRITDAEMDAEVTAGRPPESAAFADVADDDWDREQNDWLERWQPGERLLRRPSWMLEAGRGRFRRRSLKERLTGGRAALAAALPSHKHGSRAMSRTSQRVRSVADGCARAARKQSSSYRTRLYGL